MPALLELLRRRGAPAPREPDVYTLGLQDKLDSELLPSLNELLDVDWVLFTADDRMPFEHPDVISAVGVAVATVDPRRADAYYAVHEWRRDVVNKWVHVAQDQPRGTVWRYSLNSHREWRPRSHYRARSSA